MKIFLSWSGERSKAIATALKQYIPDIIQAAQPWISSEDIEKGANWPTALAENLETCQFGIICLTPENLRAPFLFFEAGALSKLRSQSNVCTLLMDVADRDLSTPFVNLQNTKIHDKTDMLRLFETINSALAKSGKEPLQPDVLTRAFERMWPEMSATFTAISQEPIDVNPVPKRSDSEILTEILDIVRSQQREQIRSARAEPYSKTLQREMLRDAIELVEDRIQVNLRKLSGASEEERSDIVAEIEKIQPQLQQFRQTYRQLESPSISNWSAESAPVTFTTLAKDPATGG